MKPLSSLQNRIFLASVAVAVLSIAFTSRFVTSNVASRAELELQRGLAEAGALVEQHHAQRAEILALMARLIADLPKLKAAVDTDDAPTVAPIALDYQERVRSDLFEVTNDRGETLAALGAEDVADPGAVARALRGEETSRFRIGAGRVFHVVTVPLTAGPFAETVGTLSLGFALDDDLAAEFKPLARSEIAFVFDGAVRASTLPDDTRPALERIAGPEPADSITLGGEEYAVTRRRLAAGEGPAPVALILRSRTERLAFLRTFRTALVAAAVVAALLAVGLGYAVARTVTRPLNAITATMREIGATGDLTRRIEPGGRWDDEDAGMLAATFNSLTESIRRFQQEAVQRSRLADLGRLSHVIAHEIRNPLMIIKGSLRSLRREELTSGERLEAAEEIDHEVARLNRLVDDVLDFARPVRLDFSETDVNALCRDAAAATLDGERRARYALELDGSLGPATTDPERLRTVLVNLLANASDAVASRGDGPADGPGIRLRTARCDAERLAIEVIDRGAGIAPEDLPRIFEPYFTTKRTGTGLGLAICRNLVDSLGGRISARSRPGEGSTIRVELPIAPRARAAEAGAR